MDSSLQKIRNCTNLFHLQCPRFTLLALMNYTQSTWRDLALPASKLKRHWRPNPPSIEQYIGKLIYHFTTHGTRSVHSYEMFLRGSCNSLFFFGPLHFYIGKYIHVQLNFDVFTIDISNIIDVLKWVKTTVQLYIYLQLLLPLDISKIYVSFGRLPLVPENKILL